MIYTFVIIQRFLKNEIEDKEQKRRTKREKVEVDEVDGEEEVPFPNI